MEKVLGWMGTRVFSNVETLEVRPTDHGVSDEPDGVEKAEPEPDTCGINFSNMAVDDAN